MAKKDIKYTGLVELATKATEPLGVLHQEASVDKVYRFVKNIAATACVKLQPVMYPSLVKSNILEHMYIVPAAAFGAATGTLASFAGYPMTAIAPSGSATGDHGWIQVQGLKNTVIVDGTDTVMTIGAEYLATGGTGKLTPAVQAGTAATYRRNCTLVFPSTSAAGGGSVGAATTGRVNVYINGLS